MTDDLKAFGRKERWMEGWIAVGLLVFDSVLAA
jgi:hypothetical protein